MPSKMLQVKFELPANHDITVMRGLREDILSSQLNVALERAKTYTKVFMENEAAPWIVKKGMAFREHLNTVPLYLRRNDKLAGAICEIPGGMPIFPELGIGECSLFVSEDPGRKGYIEGKVPSWIKEYWEDKNAWAFYRGYMKTVAKVNVPIDKIVNWTFLSCQGHLSPSYTLLLESGLGGVIERVRCKKREEYIPEKLGFLTAAEDCLLGVSEWITRYSVFLDEESRECTDPERTIQLQRMSRNCSRIATGAPAGFWEAIQLIWFMHQAIHIEGNGYSVVPDRIDQILYPFYLKDKQAGLITDNEVLTLCENFILKMRDNTFWSVEHNLTQGICLSGSTPDGSDQTNELSWMFVKASDNMHVPEPLIWIRWNRSIDQDFFDFCLETLTTSGCFPLIMSDCVVPDMLMEMGVSRTDAYNYTPVGCNEISVPGMSYFMNTANTGGLKAIMKVVDSGKEFVDFNEFIDEVKLIIRSNIEKSYKQGLVQIMVNRRRRQVPLTSCFFDGCIERGADIAERTKYNILSCGAGFFASMADMLAAVREVVYEKKEASLGDISKACGANFIKYGSLHKMLKDAPKHGNDDSTLKDIITLIEEMQSQYVREICIHPVDGSSYGISHVIRSNHIHTGKCTPATCDGRMAGAPLACSVAASVGVENSGPTAILKSIMAMNPGKAWQCGYNANIRFAGGMLKNGNNRKMIRQMLNIFFSNNGQELQINCLDTAALRDAQKNPDKYRDLIVRVAGYSEFFTKLSPDTQEEIINRTEHTVY